MDPIGTQQLQLVANTVPALLAYVDADVRYVWVNEAYLRWFGRAPETIRGRHAREIVGEAAWLAVRHHVERALAGEEVSYEARIDFGPDHTRDVKVAYVPDRDASGRVRGFVSLVTDITKMKNAERALRESEHMLAESQTSAHVGSWQARLNEDGPPQALRWSDGMYRIFGCAPGSAIDYGMFVSLVHPDDRALIRNTSRAGVAAGVRFEKEYRIVRPDGAVRVIQPGPHRAGRRRSGDGHARHKPGHHRAQACRVGDPPGPRASPGRRRRDDRPDRPLRCGFRLVWANKNYAAASARSPTSWWGSTCARLLATRRSPPCEPATARVLAGETIDLEIEVPTRRLAGAGCTSPSRPPSTPRAPWTAASRSSPTTRISGSSNESALARSMS